MTIVGCVELKLEDQMSEPIVYVGYEVGYPPVDPRIGGWYEPVEDLAGDPPNDPEIVWSDPIPDLDGTVWDCS